MIEHNKNDKGVAAICRLLDVNRSRVYYKKKGLPESDVIMMNEIRTVYEDYPFFGYRKIHAMLDGTVYECNIKRVQRLMQLAGLKALYPGKKTTLPNAQHKKYPYLLKDLKIIHSNQVYQVDITYIRIRSGFCYLVCLIDVYSRKIMGWAISPFLDTAMCLEALKNALKVGRPKILNSDQGCQFTSLLWCDTLVENGIQISMDGKGRWVDNKYIERFWRTIKNEAVYLHSFDTLAQAKTSLGLYIEFYNQKRPHQALDYETPDKKYYNRSTMKELGEINQKSRVIESEGVIIHSQIQPIFMS